ncbi:MAG: hypothetical protein KDB62_06975 [Solirubrobacterales bacterium]|nr:hypothetical protein [Solirubrobacterales bacterium]
MDEQQLRPEAGSQTGPRQVLALGHEQAEPLAVLLAGEPADQFQLFVVGAGDHLVLIG